MYSIYYDIIDHLSGFVFGPNYSSKWEACFCKYLAI